MLQISNAVFHQYDISKSLQVQYTKNISIRDLEQITPPYYPVTWLKASGNI
jgi:hypothetical protein